MKKSYLSLLCAAVVLSSCGGKTNGNNSSLAEGASGNMELYASSDVNAVEQARPTIMVLPSDNLLNKYHSLTMKTIDGKEVAMRDYAKYMIANKNNKPIISAIQNAFVQQNYPLQDLEQVLKQLQTQEAVDLVDGLEKDAKTALLSVAQPDIILELDYNSLMDMRAPIDEAQKISFTINAIDAYTSNVISSTSVADVKGKDVTSALKPSLEQMMPKLLGDIQKSFSDILTRGRNVTVRVAIATNSGINLNDATIEGDTYSDWIVDYVKTHTVKGAYKMQRNTNKEVYFVNCRIPLLAEDGTQFGVYDWARAMSKSMRKNLGVKCTNKSQGLGQILITIDGMN